jgi:prepilin-type processing-associated H-X9-DG protein
VKPGIFTLYTNSAMTWAKTIHKVGGNVALADGSVQQVTSSSLQEYILDQSLPTNRLAFP